MHEPCVGLQYFRLRPACLRLTNLVQFSFNLQLSSMICHPFLDSDASENSDKRRGSPPANGVYLISTFDT